MYMDTYPGLFPSGCHPPAGYVGRKRQREGGGGGGAERSGDGTMQHQPECTGMRMQVCVHPDCHDAACDSTVACSTTLSGPRVVAAGQGPAGHRAHSRAALARGCCVTVAVAPTPSPPSKPAVPRRCLRPPLLASYVPYHRLIPPRSTPQTLPAPSQAPHGPLMPRYPRALTSQ